jgi:hypothetical protein
MNLLNRYSNLGAWKFFEPKDKSGKTLPQAKKYPNLDFWVAYPDLEFYNENKLSLLVEVKGYTGYFNGRQNAIAMKLKSYKSYQIVEVQEKVDVRICFVIEDSSGEKKIFWESISKIKEMENYIDYHTHYEKDYETGEWKQKREKYVYWNSEDFRTDPQGLANL